MNKKKLIAALLSPLLLIPVSVFATPSSVDRITDHIQPLIKSDYIKAPYFFATSTSDTSVFNGKVLMNLGQNVGLLFDTDSSQFARITSTSGDVIIGRDGKVNNLWTFVGDGGSENIVLNGGATGPSWFINHNVGIGTNNPTQQLQVDGNLQMGDGMGSGNGSIFMDTGSITGAQNIYTGSLQAGDITTSSIAITGALTDKDGDSGLSGQFLSSTGTATDWIDSSSGTVGSGTTGQFPYYAANGTTLTATSNIFNAANGNIGIGTTSPYAKLSVVGPVVASNFIATSTTGTTATSTFKSTRISGKTDGVFMDIGEETHFGEQMMMITPQADDGTAISGIRGYLLVKGKGDAPYIYLVSQDEGTPVGNPGFQHYISQSGNNMTFNGAASYVFDNPIMGTKFDMTQSAATSTIAGGLTVDTNTLNVDFSSGQVGIGTTTPRSRLTVNGDIGTDGAIPALTGAGTGSAITIGSTDTAGEITEGTLATGATITFASVKARSPFCTITSQSGLQFQYTVSASLITITNIGALSSTKLNYHCIQNNL